MNKNNKNLGFTLAEMIVALGIVGVIAAVMVPTILTGVQKKQIPLMLSKNVANVETGCLKIIQHATDVTTGNDFLGHYNIHKDLNGNTIGTNSANSISGDNLWTGTESFFGTASLNTTEINQYKNAVKSYTGGEEEPTINSLTGNNIVTNTETGAYLGTSTVTQEQASDPIVGTIYIDVNGAKSPNMYGRDIFLYGLTDACHMVPAGSNRMNSINTALPLENNGCKNSNITNGLSCTSRVVREGYKISY